MCLSVAARESRRSGMCHCSLGTRGVLFLGQKNMPVFHACHVSLGSLKGSKQKAFVLIEALFVSVKNYIPSISTSGKMYRSYIDAPSTARQF